jgi:hypothetical protein
MEIKGRSRMCKNPRAGQPISIPGRVTQEEQHIVDHISWEITSWHQTMKQVAEETKSAKQEIEKMTKQLKRLRETRDLTDESVKYTIDPTLCDNGEDRKVSHGQCLIGPQIQKLVANRVTILSQLEAKFLHVREQTLQKNSTTNLASVEEIKQEMAFFSRILLCYDCVFGLLRRTRTIFFTGEMLMRIISIFIALSFSGQCNHGPKPTHARSPNCQ